MFPHIPITYNYLTVNRVNVLKFYEQSERKNLKSRNLLYFNIL